MNIDDFDGGDDEYSTQDDVNTMDWDYGFESFGGCSSAGNSPRGRTDSLIGINFNGTIRDDSSDSGFSKCSSTKSDIECVVVDGVQMYADPSRGPFVKEGKLICEIGIRLLKVYLGKYLDNDENGKYVDSMDD
jgi:hypothetical protein